MRLPSQTSSGVAPWRGDRVDLLLQPGGQRAALLLDVADDGVGGALADLPAVGQVDAAHARLGRELDEAGAGRGSAVASGCRPSLRRYSSTMLLPSGVWSATEASAASWPTSAAA